MMTSNGRVARNATMLTFRTVVITLISLYTSRVVLSTLGVNDFGIYGVVGGIVSVMSFINGAMAGATSRFLTFEMGRGNEQKLSRIFSSSLIVHLCLALVVALLAETIGLWFLTHKLNIAADRMEAAHWVFQFSVLSMFVNFTQSPYSASIIAHEHMHVYAYIEMLSAVLKLGIVYLLMVGHFDKLILYSALNFAVWLLIAGIYRVYCIRNFPECRFCFVWDKSVLRPMLSFSVFDLYGNMSVAVSSQGVTFLINMFFGVVYNAAATISQAVNGAILGLTTTVNQAFRPQIIKQYAMSDIGAMQSLVKNAICFTSVAMSLLYVPCLFETHYVLHLWLGNVPEHSISFFRCMVFSSFIGVNNNAFVAVIHASGDIKRLSFINGTLFLMIPVVVWCIFRLGMPAYIAYIISGIFNALIVLSSCRIIRNKIPEMGFRDLAVSTMKAYMVIALPIAIVWLLHYHLNESFGRLAFCIIVYSALVFSGAWTFLLNASSRKIVMDYVKTKLIRRKK